MTHALVGVDDFDEGQRDLCDRVDLGGQEGVDERVGVVEVEDLDLVEEVVVGPQVVVVAFDHRRLAGGVRDEGEGTGAHRVLRIVVGRDDAGGVFGYRVVEDAVGFGEPELDGAVTGSDDLVEHGEARRGGLRIVRVVDPLEAEDHVIGGDVASVGELHAFAQSRRPDGGVVVAFEGFGELGLDLVVVGAGEQAVVQVDGAGDVAAVDGDVGVDGVGGVSAGHAHPQGPALDGVTGVGGTDGPSPARAESGDRGYRESGSQRLSSVRCVHVPSS